MVNIITLFTFLEISFLAIALFFSLLYAILILFIHRFHNRNNLFILNICCTIIITCIYFIIYITITYADSQRLGISNVCIIILYAYSIASIAIPWTFVTFTIHRFCSVVYNTKAFFKTKKWVAICIAGQWIGQFLISLPFVLRTGPYCKIPLWIRSYLCIMIVIVPIVINIILNILIFIHVRSSTRRIQPHNISTLTTGNNNNNQQQQQPKISRREISLLRQMIFMFSMFIVGWSPMYFLLVINQVINVDRILYESMVLLCEISLLSLIINLFMCNHEIRHYLYNKIRHGFAH